MRLRRQMVLTLNTSHLVHNLTQALKLFSGWILELLQPTEDHDTLLKKSWQQT